MTFFKPFTVVLTASALALSGCVTDPSTVRQSADKTALYGLGGAAVCGIMGALTHGGKGARNSALVCGALGAGIGGYMDYQEQRLRRKRYLCHRQRGFKRQCTICAEYCRTNAGAISGYHADHQRPHRQHRFGCHQQPAFPTPRPNGCLLSAVPRRGGFATGGLRLRFAYACRFQRYG